MGVRGCASWSRRLATWERALVVDADERLLRKRRDAHGSAQLSLGRHEARSAAATRRWCFFSSRSRAGATSSSTAAAQRLPPGTSFFAVVPVSPSLLLAGRLSRMDVRLDRHLPPVSRSGAIAKQVAATGPVLQTPPGCALARQGRSRLVQGAFRKDFRDRFEVELALFEFTFAYERLAQECASGRRARAAARRAAQPRPRERRAGRSASTRCRPSAG